jgi:inner membrane protein
MDSLTQAALGAAIGGTVLGRRLGRKAVLIGAVLGTLPDMDTLLDYGDAVTNYTEHRGFSHSLFLLSGLVVLLTLVTTRFASARDISWRRWCLFFALCLLTHPLLDALTTYGTQLWWPLEQRPSAWPIVFIIDPLYSLPLLIGILVALITGNGQRGPALGLALSSAYLVLALGAKGLVLERLEPVLAEQGLENAPRLVQPTPFNILLWRITLVDGDRHYEGLTGLFDGDRPIAFEVYHLGARWEEAALSSRNGRRLDWFAGSFLRYEMVAVEDTPILTATDLRLGFPGFFPFTFTLLAANAKEGWRPLESELLEPDEGDRLGALARLGQRILSPEPMLCTSDFVDDRWILDRPRACR